MTTIFRLLLNYVILIEKFDHENRYAKNRWINHYCLIY